MLPVDVPDKEPVWEDSKIRKANNKLVVTVPKHWWQQDAGEVMRMRIIFEIKDGKRSVRLQE